MPVAYRSREARGRGDAASPQAGARSPLATRLFAILEVERVFFGSDFITVTKREGDWRHLKPAVLGAIMEHFLSGRPMLEAGADAAIPLLPVSDTLRRENADGTWTLVPREATYRAQTPQGFRFTAILKAHRDFAAHDVKLETETSAWAVIKGVAPGDEVALANPVGRLQAKSVASAGPAVQGGGR